MGDVLPDGGDAVEVEEGEGGEGDGGAVVCEDDVEVGNVGYEVWRRAGLGGVES